MKWLKRLLVALIVVVLVFAAAAVVFVMTVDPNDYKDLISKQVNKATGRDLRLEGDIQLSLFPWLGLELGAASLSNAPGFGEQPFASVKDAQVRVAVLPLFKGEVRADTVRLAGLQIQLIRDKVGKTNWDDLVAEPKAEAKPEPGAPEGAAPAVFAIGGLEIADASVHWQDAQNDTDVLVQPLALATGPIRLGEPVDISLDLTALNKTPQVKANLQLKTRITADLEAQRYRAEGLQLNLDAEGDTLPSQRIKAALKSEVDADLKAQRYRAKGLQLSLDAEGDTLPNKRIKAALKSDVDADLKAATVTLKPFDLETLALTLQGQVQATQVTDAPKISANLKSAPFSPRDVLKAVGQPDVKTADEGVLKKATLNLALQADADQAAISGLKITLDDSTLTGTASVRSFAKPQVAFDLQLDQIDADRYLPPPSEPTPDQEKPTAESGAATPPPPEGLGLPVDALRNLNLDGSVTIGQLKVAKLRLSQTKVVIKARDGLLTIDPAQTGLYGGSLKSRLALDVRAATPDFATASTLTQVQIGELLHDLQEKQAYLNGVSEISFDLKTSGDSVPALKKGLSGKAALAVTNGALRDPELAKKVEAVIAFLQKREPKPVGDALIFDSLTGTAQISQGVAHNQDLKLITPLILAKGAGRADIGNDTVDYTLNVALAGGAEDQERLFVPITLKGPLDNPKYGLDLESIAKQRLQEEIDKRKEDLEEKAKEEVEKIEEKILDTLKDKIKLF